MYLGGLTPGKVTFVKHHVLSALNRWPKQTAGHPDAGVIAAYPEHAVEILSLT